MRLENWLDDSLSLGTGLVEEMLAKMFAYLYFGPSYRHYFAYLSSHSLVIFCEFFVVLHRTDRRGKGSYLELVECRLQIAWT